MKILKQTLALALFTGASLGLQAQTISCSRTLKPGAAVGQDAMLFGVSQCSPVPNPLPNNQNNGAHTELPYADWSFNSGLNCNDGIIRSLIRFTELTMPNLLPVNATITGAALNLFGVPAGVNTISSGNSGSNTGLVKLIPNNMPWNENTITWTMWEANALTAGTSGTLPLAPAVAIPQSTQQWNWNQSVPIPASWVQNVVNFTTPNMGYLLHLRVEQQYRSVLFASSDHANPALWPELRIDYTVPCPSTEFSFSRYSNQPYRVDLSVNSPATLPPCATYRWKIDGTVVSTGTSLTNYNFNAPPPTPAYEIHTICLEIVDGAGNVSCSKCREICLYLSPYSCGGTCPHFKATFNTAVANTVDLTPLFPNTSSPYQWSLTSPGVASSTSTLYDPPAFTYGLGTFTAGVITGTSPNQNSISMKFCLGAQNKPGNTTSISELSQENKLVISSIRPNPAYDEVIVSMNGTTPGDVLIRLIDISGKTVIQQKRNAENSNFETKLSVNDIPSGIYILEVSNNGNTQREKLTKQ